MVLRQKCCFYTGTNTPTINTSGCIIGDGAIANPVRLTLDPSGNIICGPNGLQVSGIVSASTVNTSGCITGDGSVGDPIRPVLRADGRINCDASGLYLDASTATEATIVQINDPDDINQVSGFVMGQSLKGPSVVWQGGTANDPDYVWFVGKDNSTVRIEDPNLLSSSGCLEGVGTAAEPLRIRIAPSGGLECGVSGLQIKGDGCCQVYSYESGSAPSGLTAPADPASNPVEGTLQIEVYDDCVNYWVYNGTSWQLDKQYCPNTNTNLDLVTATASGQQRPHGRTAIAAGSVIALGDSSSYTLSASGTYSSITGGDAARDGDVIRVDVGSTAVVQNSWQSGGNIKLDGNVGNVVPPSGGANLTLWYNNSTGNWEEVSRIEY